MTDDEKHFIGVGLIPAGHTGYSGFVGWRGKTCGYHSDDGGFHSEWGGLG